MAIIRCPDCGKEISGLAVSCIHCGRPIIARADSRQAGAEEFSYKGLFGAFIAVVGLIIGIVGAGTGSGLAGIIGIVLLIAGASYGAKNK